MEAESRCSFCQQLPTLSKFRRGKPARCPVCRGKLLETGDVTYRLTDDIGPAGFRLWPMAVLLAAIGGIASLSFGFANLRQEDSSQVSCIPPQETVSSTQKKATGEAAEAAGAPKTKAVVFLPINSQAPKPAPLNLPVPIKVWTKKSPSQPMAARVKGSLTSATTAVAKWPIPSLEDFPWDLAKVPEVGLDQKFAEELRAAHVSRERRRDFPRRNEKLKEADPVDAQEFLEKLRKKQPWLAELPIRQGKDCLLVAKKAKNFGIYSISIRCAMATPQRQSLSSSSPTRLSLDPGVFWRTLEKLPRSIVPDMECNWHEPEALRALGQILAVADAPFRTSLVEHLGKGKEKTSSVELARTALFDEHLEVRQAALAVLKSRPQEEFVPTLLEGLQFPWVPVAHHAAAALVELKVQKAMPALVELLDEPDPGMPVKKGNQYLVRELVRINHHANCMLCHAPSKSVHDPARGPVPQKGKPLPSLADYFEPDQAFVRADVTYLRQDFSALLYVVDHGTWPTQQRFDFVVRSRILKKEEVPHYHDRAPEISEHKQAIRYALHALTGIDAGFSASTWRQALAIPTRQTNWHSPCLK